MALTFRRFKHKKTGQVIYAPTGRYGNFLDTIKKIVSYVRYNIPRYYVAHLTLTVSENISEVDFKHLHRVIQFVHLRLKRAGSDFKYVAVKELQDRGAVHYHVLCIYSKPYVFPSPDEVASSWRLGFVKITAPKIRLRLQSIAGYIGKYIGKGYEYNALEIKKSFTASQVRQIYKLSPKRLAEVIERFGKDEAEKFMCTYRRVYEVAFSKIREYVLDDIFLAVRERTVCIKKELVMEFESEWDYMGVLGEPY